MREEKYDSEDLLQRLLADYPKILAGDQIDQECPRRWLLISREMGVRDEEEASNRWSLDHLFIDQEGIPTFVEVKRSTDTRARREVVAQMLDYAANGVEYWRFPELKEMFEHRCTAQGKDPVLVLHDELGADIDYEGIWLSVQKNLEHGHIRLLFVADEIPRELKRIVEFLNEKMHDVDVLAVEVKQFTGENLKTLVPRVIGQTALAEREKTARELKIWNKEAMLERLESNCGVAEKNIVERIFSWIEHEKIPFSFGTGSKEGNCLIGIPNPEGKIISVFSIRTDSFVFVLFNQIKKLPAFNDEPSRKRIISLVNEKLGTTLSPDQIDGWPSFLLSQISSPDKILAFQDLYRQICHMANRE